MADTYATSLREDFTGHGPLLLIYMFTLCFCFGLCFTLWCQHHDIYTCRFHFFYTFNELLLLCTSKQLTVYCLRFLHDLMAELSEEEGHRSTSTSFIKHTKCYNSGMAENSFCDSCICCRSFSHIVRSISESFSYTLWILKALEEDEHEGILMLMLKV